MASPKTEHYLDIVQGLTKPLFSGFIIATVGCYCGLKTTGGTQGVGRATTQAVVISSVFIAIYLRIVFKEEHCGLWLG